jgi:hypothetical protein
MKDLLMRYGFAASNPAKMKSSWWSYAVESTQMDLKAKDTRGGPSWIMQNKRNARSTYTVVCVNNPAKRYQVVTQDICTQRI